MKTILYSIMILTLCASCGNLSRSKAKEEIIKKQNLPQVETVSFPKKYRIFDERTQHLSVDGMEAYSVYETKLKELEAGGYIKLTEEQFMYDAGGIIGSWLIRYMNVELTDKGKKDLTNETESDYIIRFCDLGFGEITGIAESKEFGRADVNYTVVRANISEFGKAIKEIKSSDANTVSFDRHAVFSKYDDGWRIGK